jgi:hypothetical protein
MDSLKLNIRGRERNHEIQQPMAYSMKNDNSRLETMQRVPYDTEGFDLNFFLKYKFRDDASPDKIVDKKHRFKISTNSNNKTFDQMRPSLENRSFTSKNLNNLK